jgi:hypothetical protein
MIHILSHEHTEGFNPEEIHVAVSDDYLIPLQERSYAFLPDARSAIKFILKSLNIKPEHDVYITNTTGQLYISSCVACSIFNFCRPSRVLTKDTRAIFVIHEYGIPHPKIFDLIDQGRRRGIPVIEDCAHTFDSKIDNRLVGTIGDFSLYSLSKIFPIKSGGILTAVELPNISHNEFKKSQLHDIENEFHNFGPFLSYFSSQRKRNFNALRRFFEGYPVLFETDPHITPYFFGVNIKDAFRIRSEVSAVEWGSTLQGNLLLFPTNPMINSNCLVDAAKEVIQAYA